ncbi:hypothetical protein BABINDRAFT_94553 [Babjeviella inositovora NRRL Y-12698]|uniref:DUF1760-domain-containing protein n=1 Tax=Babjeviella inositovora NRRL Y-12698 TaxID=984486 RepID=A0A1E3QL76_9ASCO|nr:uncharacterized protein BABINDRAFT_94553 [Babjeviella inositovora NRRL Y-12698]ODQ77842.1 hypothetical protein BABINDRAFT_94553 [Babjeviella inositovora NRRL Y-12698]
MSDTESPSSPLPAFETIIQNIELAAKDAIESKDYLSYSTLLDIYLDNPYAFTEEQRTAIVTQLLDVLSNTEGSKELIYEVGWDLPALLLKYLHSHFAFHTPIRNAPCFHQCVKIFDLLSRFGNPKELFLKSCELLSVTTRVDADDAGHAFANADRILLLKFYLTLELMSATLKRIVTIYPSRFLSMALTALLSFVNKNIQGMDNVEFVVKRLYVFTRDYVPPQIPADDQDAEIEDEEYLQAKLLKSFSTHLVEIVGRQFSIGWSMELYPKLVGYKNGTPKEQTKTYAETDLHDLEDADGDLFSKRGELMDRMMELVISQDVDLRQCFDEEISKTRDLQELLQVFAENPSVSENDLNEHFVTLIVQEYYQQASANKAEMKEIPLSSIGLLTLYAHKTLEGARPVIQTSYADLSAIDIFLLTLRYYLPLMASTNAAKSFSNKALNDVLLSFALLKVIMISETDAATLLSLSKSSAIVRIIIKAYLQVLLTECCSNMDLSVNHRMVFFTLMTKVLALVSDDVSFEFIADSLKSCPFPNGKVALIGVLKDLCVKDKKQKDSTDELTEKLATVKLSGPPLPPRSTKFIPLTHTRKLTILQSISQTVDELFHDPHTIQPAQSQMLIAYLNFLVATKQFFIQDEDSSMLLEEIVEKLDAKLAEVKSSYEEGKDGQEMDTVVGLLELGLERLGL